VTVTAASVTDPTKSASATISVGSAPIALADGNYVFSTAGSDVNLVSSAVAGVFTVSGGAINGGEQDYVDQSNADLHDGINPTGSSYTTTADGNLQIVLTTCTGACPGAVDTAVGGGTGIETFNAALVSGSTCGTTGGPCTARLIEFDALASSGTLELQSSTAAPSGSYAFGATGAAGFPAAVGGIFSVTGTTISTTATVFDLNQGGTPFTNQSISAGSTTPPDATGRLQISMTPTSGSLGVLAFATYVVDANHAQIINASGPLSGTAYLQNTASLAVAGKTYVVSTTGIDNVAPLQLAGTLTLAQGSTAVSGTISYNDTFNAIQPAGAITGGAYVADATFPGRVTLTGVTDGNANNNPNTYDIQLYVDGNGHALVVTLGPTEVMGGVGYEQSGGGSFTAGSFNGSYALNISGYDFNNAVEYDAVGPISADGVGSLSSSAIDLNWPSAAPTSGLTVSGTFTSAASGVFPGTLTGIDVSGQTSDTYTYYVVDTTTVVAIEVDGGQWGLGILEFQQ
jgi:hypothetical protein